MEVLTLHLFERAHPLMPLIRRHVFGDLLPYVCTFEFCPKPDHLYATRQAWFEHESQIHRREWYCEACDLTLYEEEAMIEHLAGAHKEQVSKTDYSSAAGWCERARVSNQPCPICPQNSLPTEEHLKKFHRNDLGLATDLSAEAQRLLLRAENHSCPYCPIKYERTQLRRHIGHHLQQMALFVLPHPSQNDVQVDDDSGKLDADSQGACLDNSEIVSEIDSNIDSPEPRMTTQPARVVLDKDFGPDWRKSSIGDCVGLMIDVSAHSLNLDYPTLVLHC